MIRAIPKDQSYKSRHSNDTLNSVSFHSTWSTNNMYAAYLEYSICIDIIQYMWFSAAAQSR